MFASGSSVYNKRMRLLVVEDEPDLLQSLAEALREDGYAVDTASRGDDGLHKARSWDYDAIVLDWMLPGIHGMEFLQRLRREKKTPVLLLTARDTVSDRVQGLDSGADDYVVKPCSLRELLARVRALIRRSSGHASNVIEIGSVRIDTGRKTVHDGDQDIVLTAREYALVELLALNRGKLVSRSMIYDHIFDEDDDSLSNIVEVHVSHIRKKLGKDFIETRRGQGYLLDG
jgi:two-component system, OmpR family, response regulator